MIKCFYLIVSLFLIFGTIFAQKPIVSDTIRNKQSNEFAATLTTYIQNHPEEKIHVQFDRGDYQIGDTVWFKVYVLNGYNNQLSALSKVVHIDVANEEGFSQKLLLPVSAGMADGHLVLSPDKYRSGNYSFKAFTKLMSSTGHGIYIYNLQVSAEGSNNKKVLNSSNQTKDVTHLTFFPEGGKLVAGLKSKVVVKTTGNQNQAKLVQGYVMDDKNTKVAVFNTSNSGLGLFAYTPQKNIAYKAIVENDVAGATYILPQALDNGYILALNNIVNDTLPIRISKSGIALDQVRLLFQANGNIVNSVIVSLSPISAIVKVPTASLPSGLNEIALLSMNNEPLANRFLFLPEPKSSVSSLSIDRNEYGIREKVKLKLMVTDSKGAGILGGYSISVSKVDTSQIDRPAPPAIFSSLIFNSDNKKNDFDSFNFDGPGRNEQSEIDMRLLTDKLGSFSLLNLLDHNKKTLETTIEQGLSISGTVFNSKGKPMAGVKLNLFSANEMILIDTVANDKGQFVFQNFSVYDSAEVVIRVKNLGSEKNVTIILDDLSSNLISKAGTSSVPSSTLGKDSNSSLPEPTTPINEKSNTLKTVEIKSKRRVEVKGSVYPFAAAPPDFTIEKEELDKALDLVEYLRSRFHGMFIKNNVMMGRYQGKEGPMIVLLNGLKIEDLSSIIPSSLTGVQIVKGGMPAASMSNQFGQATQFGIVFLTSDREGTSLRQRPQQTTGIVSSKILGFQSPKEFQSPIYLSKTDIKGKDLRAPLFWKPDVITNEDGMAELEFFTSDETGRYQIILEGVGINGRITREISYFTVQ